VAGRGSVENSETLDFKKGAMKGLGWVTRCAQGKVCVVYAIFLVIKDRDLGFEAKGGHEG
jgi:hypothetical protein